MNKSQFLKELSLISNMSVNACNKVLNNTYLLLCDNLRKGQSVVFYGFGKFYVRNRKERILDNSKLIPAKNIPAFKTGKYFKNIVN